MDVIRQMEKERALKKLETFKEVYSKIVKETIRQAELHQNICTYHIPEYGINSTIDIDSALPWIMGKLRKEGFDVTSLEGVKLDTGPEYAHRIGTKYDIFIRWKKADITEYESMIQLDDSEDAFQNVFLNSDRMKR